MPIPEGKDNNQKTPQKGRQIRRNNGRPAEQMANELTCKEADVDDLLSAGELT